MSMYNESPWPESGSEWSLSPPTPQAIGSATGLSASVVGAVVCIGSRKQGAVRYQFTPKEGRRCPTRAPHPLSVQRYFFWSGLVWLLVVLLGHSCKSLFGSS
ncbi:hypothetical protein F4859DRAFT_178782 [Xylaria cf. heliscus]|nr:hypothetical protein F4859DRAFT_178782 [Xylaria cf. heliscus]